MTRTPLLITLAAAAALAGCNKESHTIVAGADRTTTSQRRRQRHVAAAAVDRRDQDLPLRRQQLVYVDWLSDNKSANVRTDKGGAPTR